MIEHRIYENGVLIATEQVEESEVEAEVRGMKERAAAEASKASQTAKSVAEAVAGPTS